jgi:hypothetical protein
MQPDVFSLLNVAAIQAFVGSPARIYRHGIAPQSTTGPYLTWFNVDGVPENHLDGTPPVDAFALQVDCWSANSGDGSTQVNALAKAVRDQIETAHDITSFSGDAQDFETQRYRITITFTFWNPRDS